MKNDPPAADIEHARPVSGPPCDSRQAALQAGFEAARRSLTRHA